jgi:phage-related protein
MAEETVVIKFIGDDQVSKVADQAGNAIDGVSTKAKASGGGFSALQSIAVGAFQAIGGAAVNLAGAAFSKITDFVSGSIAEASAWNSVIAQTEAVVKSTGMAAGFTAQQLADMAGSMSATSGNSIFADDAILGAQNVLATFTQIKGVSFKGATQAILDISQAMGTDLQSSALQVGKALNDPVAGISALSRVGVSFTEDQKALIQSMVDVGDVAGAQQIIIDELGKEFGGSAAAAVDTFAGQQIVLAEQFADVKQSLGESLLPVLMRFGAFAQENLVPAVEDLVNVFIAWIDGVDWPAVMSFLEGIADALYDFIYGTDWQSGLDGISAGFDSFMSFIAPITTALSELWTTVEPILSQLYNAIVTGIASPEVQSQLKGVETIFGLLADIIVSVLAIAIDGMRIQWQAMYDTFTVVWPYIQSAIRIWMTIMKPLQDLVTGVLTAISQALKGDFSGAWDTVKTAVTTFATTVNNAVQGMVTAVLIAVGTMMVSLANQALSIGSAIANGIAKGIQNGVTAITNAAKSAAQSALDAAMKLLGIASPSKVFADQVGYQMSAGMAAGIMRGIPDVTGAIGGATGAAVGAVNQTTQNYYLSASYQTAQSESSISQDLRAMQLLAGGMA